MNAGIIPATVTITECANLWASVFPNITPQPSLIIASEGDLAFAVRKENPKLKQLVDDSSRPAPRARHSGTLCCVDT